MAIGPVIRFMMWVTTQSVECSLATVAGGGMSEAPAVLALRDGWFIFPLFGRAELAKHENWLLDQLFDD
jgi:hypothetical protein